MNNWRSLANKNWMKEYAGGWGGSLLFDECGVLYYTIYIHEFTDKSLKAQMV